MANSTTNYKQFKDLSYNREVDKAHVKRLVKSIQKKNLLHLNPIIVSKDMEIIDGQHRLEAAKALKLPIHYIMSEEPFEGSEMQQLNSASKNWTAVDYLNYWTIKKARGYAELSKFINQYPQIPLTSSRKMISASGENRTQDFQNGKLNVGNIAFAEKVAEQLKDYRNKGYTFIYTSKFVDALISINNVEGYDHEKMMRKIDMQPRALVPCANMRQYLEMFEEIYNYKDQYRVRFR